jgi:hypothetical protein
VTPWIRSDLTSAGLGRGLVVRSPRIALTDWHPGYTLTGPDGRTRTGLTLGQVLDWCRGVGIAAPTEGDLAWLAGGEA